MGKRIQTTFLTIAVVAKTKNYVSLMKLHIFSCTVMLCYVGGGIELNIKTKPQSQALKIDRCDGC